VQIPQTPKAANAQVPTATSSAASVPSIIDDVRLWTIIDPEMARVNPVEDKHRRLIRSHRSGPFDRELKPDPNTRDSLSVR
jgi:phosphatidylinositol 3-kinase